MGVDDIDKAAEVAASALRANGLRMRVAVENLANAQSVAPSTDGEPYRRKAATFQAVLDRELGATIVKSTGIIPVGGEFPRRYDPNHPASTADGFVKLPNVNFLSELNDLRSAQGSYESNMQVLDITDTLKGKLVKLLDT